MKKIGELMEELGFNKDAPDSVKEAFIRHLIKVSTGTVVPPREALKKVKPEDQQLSFTIEENPSSKKAM